MEKLLHFGINRINVKEQYNRVLAYKFPDSPEDDNLYDLFSELVEIDGYIMGMVSKYLKNGEIDLEKLKCDDEFMRIYAQIGNISEEMYEIIKYKEELDKLIGLFIG